MRRIKCARTGLGNVSDSEVSWFESNDFNYAEIDSEDLAQRLVLFAKKFLALSNTIGIFLNS